MPNKNYVNGRRKEYKVMEQLRKIGCDIVFRSAGSHSAIDVIGIHRKMGHIICIQCKPKSMSDKKKDEIFGVNNWLNGVFTSTFEVI